jgi:hypothetical protein
MCASFQTGDNMKTIQINRPVYLITLTLMACGHFVGPNPLVPAAAAQGSDIRSYGARCDGSDDTGAVQSALNALSSGGTLNVPCVARISRVMINSRSNVTVAGSNGGGFSLIYDAGDPWDRAFLVVNCASCTFRDLLFEANNKSYVPFEIRYSSNTTVSGLNIRNVGHAGTAFLAYSNNYNKYLNNTIQNVDLDRNPGNSDAARGMYVGGVSDSTKETNVTISGNRFLDISATALAVHGSAMTISNNTGQRLSWACIKVLPLGGSGSTVISGNNCSGAGAKWLIGGGIMTEYFNSSYETTTIRDNVIEGYSDGDVGRIPYSPNVGINIANAPGKVTHNIQILNNTIRNILFDSIQITGNTDSFLIEGNLLERTNSSGMQWNGINLQGESGINISNGMIRNNMIRGKFDGIRIGGNGGAVNGVTLQNNSIVSSSRDGLHIEVSNGGQVNGLNVGTFCFASIGYKTIWDNRPGGLSPISLSPSCGSPTSGASVLPPVSIDLGPISVSTGGTTTTQPAPSAPAQSPVLIRVNAGGGGYTDPQGNQWSADFGSNVGYLFSNSRPVSGTSTPALYQTCRWYNNTLNYQFNVPNGSRTVTLKFAEIYWDGPNQRVFNVAINGQTVLANFDIAAAAGGSFRAVDRTFPVNVTNGIVSISMVSSVDEPMLNAIEIR